MIQMVISIDPRVSTTRGMNAIAVKWDATHEPLLILNNLMMKW